MSTHKLPRGVYFAIIASVLILAGMVYAYFFYPYAEAGTAQPIPFSHRLHVGIKQLDCLFCHNTVEQTRFAGMPAVGKCLYCHEHIIPNHPAIRKLKAYAGQDIPEYAEITRNPVPWKKVTWLPDHVYFSHQRHIKAGVTCFECHGDVGNMERVKNVFTNQMDRELIHGSQFKMGFCMECHQGDVALNGKAAGYEHAATTAELIERRRAANGESITYDGTRAPVDCWTCHQ